MNHGNGIKPSCEKRCLSPDLKAVDFSADPVWFSEGRVPTHSPEQGEGGLYAKKMG